MSKLNKSLISGVLSIATLVSFSGALLPVVANAQTASGLQAQISALLAQIQQLQSQLASQGGSSSAYNYTRDLTVGSKGADVTALQGMLISGGHLKVAATGYFGALTKAALAQWQGTNGITPAVGYFGPKTRAFINSMAGGPAPSPAPGPGPVPAPAGGLSVSLASDNPAVGSLIAGAGRVPVLGINVTAGNASGITLNGIKFYKNGVISDSNISGAYLVKNGAVVAQYNSLSGGVITFSGLNLSIAAGQTQEYWLAIDVSTGVTAGNTLGFSVASAADVSAVDATNAVVTSAGTFPVNGTTFTASTVSNPSLATLTISSSTVGSTVYAGTQGVLVSQWSTSASNNPVWLRSIKFKVIGSANKSDLQNVKLFINGTQVGSTLSAVGSDGAAYFDLTSASVKLNTGTSNMQVYADVMGSPSFNFQFELLNSYDVYAVDSQYNTSLTPTITGGSGVQVTIQQGQTTLSLSSDSPTGNIAKNQSNVTLGKFKMYAAGEAVRIKFLDFSLTFTGSSSVAGLISGEVKNVQLVDDAGNQVGSTISTPASSNTCTGSGVAAGNGGAGNLVYSDCFGTSASAVNYVIPANTTRVLSLKADIGSSANFGTVKASITSETGKQNLQGLTSSQLGDTGAGVAASALSLSANSLTVAQNSGVGTQTVTKSSTNQLIGSYAMTASTAEGVTISNITITVGANAATNFQNLKFMVGSTQFGSTQPTLTASQAVTFSGTPFSIPVGGTQTVNVYADVLSGAGTNEQATTLSSCSGNGSVSFSSVSCSSTNGQTVNIGGAPTLSVGLDSTSPAAGQVVMGTTQAPLAAFRFTETSNNEDVKITDLNVFQATGATTTPGAAGLTKSAVSNLTLYQGASAVGSAGSANASANQTGSSTGNGYYYSFHFATPVVVPKGNSITLALKGDVSSWSSQGATDNSTSSFQIATSSDTGNLSATGTVTALGNSSQAVATPTLSNAKGQTQTFLRSNLMVVGAGPLNGITTGRGRSTADDVGTITFTAPSAGSVNITALKVSFAGSLASSTTFTATTTDIRVYDPSTSANLDSGSGTATLTISNGSGTLALAGLGYVLSAGNSKTFYIRIDSVTHAAPGTANIAQSFSASIASTADVSYIDGLDASSTGNIHVPASIIPVSITAVSYPVGG